MRLTRFSLLFLVMTFALFAAGTPRPAPPLEIKTADGRTISLEHLKGKVVAVMFFSTDCPHCQQTTQILNPIYDQWKSRGLEILGLAINPTAATNLGSFARKYGAKFPLALSMTAECNRFAGESVMRRFSVPYLFLVDRQGRIREEHSGRDRKFWLNQNENLRSSLDALLNEPAKGKKSSS